MRHNLLDKHRNISNVKIDDNNVFVELLSTQNHSYCPCCNKKSSRIHSKYNRTLMDLPLLGKKVILQLKSRKFFCDNTKCNQTVFT